MQFSKGFETKNNKVTQRPNPARQSEQCNKYATTSSA